MIATISTQLVFCFLKETAAASRMHPALGEAILVAELRHPGQGHDLAAARVLYPRQLRNPGPVISGLFTNGLASFRKRDVRGHGCARLSTAPTR